MFRFRGNQTKKKPLQKSGFFSFRDQEFVRSSAFAAAGLFGRIGAVRLLPVVQQLAVANACFHQQYRTSLCNSG